MITPNNLIQKVYLLQTFIDLRKKEDRTIRFSWYTFDYHEVVGGISGGIGRALVESPFEFIKIRRQVKKGWSYRELTNGFSETISRNTLLFGSFIMYLDLIKQFNGGEDPSAFVKGAVAANMAWITAWPLEVRKSQVQSGAGFSSLRSFKNASSGILPGLIRSTLANGSSMVVYTYVKEHM